MVEKGQVVRSLAGHDKHRYYVVVEATMDWVLLVDGKSRKLEKPKKKNRVHVRPTHTIVKLDDYLSNSSLRKMLEPMNQSLLEGYKVKGGK